MANLTISNFPIGYICPVINSNIVPTGSLECNGASISITTYSNLFSGSQMSIGGLYGTGAGNFRLPDYRGRSLRGWSHGTGRDPDAATRFADSGGITGDNVGSMQDDIAKIHDHLGSIITTGLGFVAVGGATQLVSTPPTPVTGNFVLNTVLSGYRHNTGTNIGNTSVETRSKNFYAMWCIKY